MLMTDIILGAILDGEIDDEERREFESEMSDDMRKRLSAFNNVDVLLKRELDAVIEEPAPNLMPDVSRSVRSRNTWDLRLFSSSWFGVPTTAIVTAGLCFLVFNLWSGSFGDTAGDSGGTEEEQKVIAQQISDKPPALINNILETSASGINPLNDPTIDTVLEDIRILSTWRLADGTYCREYTLERDNDYVIERGVACRASPGEWRYRMRLYPNSTLGPAVPSGSERI